MDTLTHALVGAVAASGVKPEGDPERRRLFAFAAVAGGIVPDIDYLLFWWNPLLFLADWHRGPTHSLVLLPVWAALLTGLFIAWRRSWYPQRHLIFTGACLGISSHILLDLVSVFGLKLFYPLTSKTFALGISFDFDAVTAMMVLFAATAVYLRPRRATVLAGLATLLVYVILQWQVRFAVEDALADRNPAARPVLVPQPFSPLHWRVIMETPGGYQTALLALGPAKVLHRYEDSVPAWMRPAFQYRPFEHLQWARYTRLGRNRNDQILAGAVWQHGEMEPLRRFARYPMLYRIDRGREGKCVWFTDLRYVIAFVSPPFRYGMCRDDGIADWRPYRLKRFTRDARQPLALRTGADVEDNEQ